MKLLLTEKEKCPRCGVEFDCSKSGKCWCFEVDVSPSILENVQDKYQSCLCPDCLQEIANESKTSK